MRSETARTLKSCCRESRDSKKRADYFLRKAIRVEGKTKIFNKMKKIFFGITLIGLMVMTAGFVSCSKDEGEKKKEIPNVSTLGINGTIYKLVYSGSANGVITDPIAEGNEYIVLNDDGMVFMFETGLYGNYFNNRLDCKEYMIRGEVFRLYVEGKWESSNGKITLSLWNKCEEKYIDFPDGEVVQYSFKGESRITKYKARYTITSDGIERWDGEDGDNINNRAGSIERFEKVSGFYQ